jgi:hypothetical protein
MAYLSSSAAASLEVNRSGSVGSGGELVAVCAGAEGSVFVAKDSDLAVLEVLGILLHRVLMRVLFWWSTGLV